MSQVIQTKTIKENGTIAIKNGIKPNSNKNIFPSRKPAWLRLNYSFTPKFKEVKSIVKENHLKTVCEEAMCPNISECWSNGTATFMLLGDVCTRACKFCAVDTGNPRGRLDKKEPSKVAQSIKNMLRKQKISALNIFVRISVLYIAGQWLNVNDAFDLAEARKISWAKNFN